MNWVRMMSRLTRITGLCLSIALMIQAAAGIPVWADDTVVSAETEEEVSVQEETAAEPELYEETDEDQVPDDVSESDEGKRGSLEVNADPAPEEGQEDPEDPDTPDEPEPLSGWVTRDGKKYYYKDGKPVTGMRKIDGAWYYFKSGGAMKTGWLTIDEDRYYFDPETGKRYRGMKKIGTGVYYFKSGGRMARGWLKVSGRKYFHNKKNGKRIFGSQRIGKYRYYFNPKNGRMKTGWLKLKGRKYYYDAKGHKLYGDQTIKGRTYYLDLHSGARTSKGKYYLYKAVWNKSSSTKYLIYVDKGSRWLSVYQGKYRDWELVKRVRCTIGAPGTPTPAGTFRVVSKVSHFGEGKGYTVWHATGFIGTSYLIHSVVCYRGTKTVKDGRLGAAVSHGCVRLAIGQAKWIYDHIPHGTTVYIK